MKESHKIHINVFDRTLFPMYVMICYFGNRFILEGHIDSIEETAIYMKMIESKYIIVWNDRK